MKSNIFHKNQLTPQPFVVSQDLATFFSNHTQIKDFLYKVDILLGKKTGGVKKSRCRKF